MTSRTMKKTTMTKKTHERLVERLVKDIDNHSHKDELLYLMLSQIADDANPC